MESTVPNADPSTPKPQYLISTKLNTTFKTDVKTKKNSGVRLSPAARIKPDNKLSATIKIVPAPKIKINRYDSSNIPSGTFKTIINRFKLTNNINVRTTLNTKLALIECVTERRIPSKSFAPKRCAVTAVKPPVKLKATIKNIK